MTWSLLHRTPEGGLAIAVATCAFAVGSRVPFVAPGVGAVASQAMVNPLYGIDGLAHLRAELSAEEAIARVSAADAGREHRQVHMVTTPAASPPARGRIACPGAGIFCGKPSPSPATCSPAPR